MATTKYRTHGLHARILSEAGTAILAELWPWEACMVWCGYPRSVLVLSLSLRFGLSLTVVLGSLFTDATTAWNVAHLPSALSRLLPSSNQGLPGVNTPYLYFGMWRATFAWHVEDMDLFSINYIHFGAPKFWYAIPQGRAIAMEQTMRGIYNSCL